MSIISDIRESIQTRDRLYLSVFISLKKMVDNQQWEDVMATIDDLIDVQKKNLKDW